MASGPPAGGAFVMPTVLGAGTLTSSIVVPSTKQMEHSVAPTFKQAKVRIVEPRRHPCLLNSLGSTVTEAELDELHHHFSIPRSIFPRVPKMDELLQYACEDVGEIAFPLVVFECWVRRLLAPFVKRLLSEFSLHLFKSRQLFGNTA